MKELKQKLKKKSKEWLIDRLVELSMANDANANRMELSLAVDVADSQDFVDLFKRQIDEATEEISDHGPGSWTSQLPTAGFDSVVDTLAEILPKNLQAVMEISEYALMQLDTVFELQDECELEYLVDEFRDLHLKACGKLKPDPVALGSRLAMLNRQTEWGFFDGPPGGYSKVLGKEGMAAFLSTKS